MRLKMKINDFISSKSTGKNRGSVTCDYGNGFILMEYNQAVCMWQRHPVFRPSRFLFLFLKKRS